MVSQTADQHHAVAQFSLGIMYASGEGLPHSDSEAAQWYRLAADQGLGGAQFNLGILYTEGKGVPFEWMIERRHRAQQKNLAVTLR